ncbi:MAG TPA: VOC family protein [Pseudolabrys sp.]|nr:VOC family protein [Pseudolabrys sp.]
MRTGEDIDRRLPLGDEIFLDHVGHFVRDPHAAAAALSRAGFAPTPISIQVNPDPAGAAPQPSGTGNVTAMLDRGYLEVLFKSADTPLGRELDMAVARYEGVQLAAFAIANAERAHERLEQAGFPMRPLVRMQRPVDTATGPDLAAFTVVRLERGTMPEGRIQMLTHRTEATVWQPRWLTHPNSAVGLLDLVIAVADPEEAAQRFSRFTARDALPNQFGRAVVLDRGRVQLVRERDFAALFPELPIPGLPFCGVYGICVRSLDTAAAALSQNRLVCRRHRNTLFAPFPQGLGLGAWIFVEAASELPWR